MSRADGARATSGRNRENSFERLRVQWHSFGGKPLRKSRQQRQRIAKSL